MQIKKRFLLLVLSLKAILGLAQETINVMSYNLLDFPEAPPSNRAEILKIVIDNYQPDIFMTCEIQSEAASDLILNTSLQTTDNRYKRAPFVYNQSSNDANLQQTVFYNSKKLVLTGQNEIITTIRDINHYVFNLVSDISGELFIDIFVAHLKSSQGYDNEQLRLDMVLDFTTYLATVPKDHFILIGGDFNLYTSAEPAYLELLDASNSIVLKDPLNRPGGWHNNQTFEDIHTQSTRLSSFSDGLGNFYGAGGGMDDRFDFILTSENLLGSADINYVPASYKAFGNNGNCFNKRINDPSCTGTYSQAMRDVLYNLSDHLPVVLQLEVPYVLSTAKYNDNQYFTLPNGNIIENELTLKCDTSLYGGQISIFNSLGQKVRELIISHTIETIDMDGISKGIYYIALNSNNSIRGLKFIKN